MKPCTRCGECCKTATACEIRGWFAEDHNQRFSAPCDQLEFAADGTASCRAIASMFTTPEIWYPPTLKFITEEFLGRGCELERNREKART